MATTTRPRQKIIEIPHLLSFLATGTFSGAVEGLTQLQQQYQHKYGTGNYVPNVFIQYWSMRVMAYLGSLIALLAVWGDWLRAQGHAGALQMVFARRDLERGDPVCDEHRGLAVDREQAASRGSCRG